ncbi:hypothetical protein ABVK25_012359 [Lepraria finkii]|uniref:Apple domain-containing protein n=1 Tax=Lepraria finkii TaxID=1340010 RepID=A0ABR4AIV8_9LECA
MFGLRFTPNIRANRLYDIMTIIQTSDTSGSLATVDETLFIPATTTISSETITTVETFAITLDISATDTIATVSLTEIEISTDTIKAPTDYPNCDNLVSQVNGQPINIIDNATNVVNIINDVDNAYNCCVICQNTVLCGATYYMNGMCSMVMAETCLHNTSLGYFESIFSDSAGYILSNGTCGMLVHRGRLGDPSDG